MITITSFGYRHAPAPEATVTVDLRECLRDPHVDPALRNLTGEDPDVVKAVLATPGARMLASQLFGLAAGLAARDMPVSVAIGCAGGRHRSVVLAALLATELHEVAPTRLVHRDVALPVLPPRQVAVYTPAQEG
jgi:UPF0042 nucleotide-binding protein